MKQFFSLLILLCSMVGKGQTPDIIDASGIQAAKTMAIPDDINQAAVISDKSDAPTIIMSVSRQIWNFGNVVVGQRSTTYQFTVSNAATSNAPLSISWPSLGPEFSVVPTTVPPLNPGQSGNITVTFHPTTISGFIQTFAITNNSTNLANPYNITLKGDGVSKVVNMSVSPISWPMGSFPTGQTVTNQFTISNASTSNTPLTISWPPLGSQFSVSPLTTNPISPGSSKTFTVSFRTTTAGPINKTWTLYNNSTNLSTAHGIALTGTSTGGVVNMNVSSNTVDFGTVTGAGTRAKTITISNQSTSTGPLIISFASQGLSQGFTVNSTGSISIAPGQSREITFNFNPTTSNTFNQTWTITNNSTNLSQTYNLTLKGIRQL